MPLISPAQLDAIRVRHAAAPPGPWVVFSMLNGYQLLSQALVDTDGKLRPAQRDRRVPYVLATKGGQAFIVQAHDDVGRLLEHADALELKCLELEARMLRMKSRDRAGE